MSSSKPKPRKRLSARTPQPRGSGVSPVQQSGVKESSAQFIVDMAAKRQSMLPQGQRQPRYEDFSTVSHTDFHAAMNLVQDLRGRFASLPSRTRAAFSNDPYQLLRALDDPKQQPRLVELGLKEAPRKAPPSLSDLADEAASRAVQKASQGGSPGSEKAPKGGQGT